MTTTSNALSCEFAALGRVFILRWNSVPNAPSVRAARAALLEAWKVAGEQPLVLLLVIASTSGIPDSEARVEIKAFTSETRRLTLACWSVIEAEGAMATIIKSTIGILGAAAGVDTDWMQFGGTAEAALRELAARVEGPADELVASARKRRLIA